MESSLWLFWKLFSWFNFIISFMDTCKGLLLGNDTKKYSPQHISLLILFVFVFIKKLLIYLDLMQHDRILDYGERGVAIKDNIETISIK